MKCLFALLFSASILQGALAGRCYRCSLAYADPHLITFQGNHYQCQGRGDFIMSKSLSTDFEVQARFYIPDVVLDGGRNGSTVTAAVINTDFENEAKVEMRVVPEGRTNTTEGLPASSVHDCDIHYYVNGQQREFNNYDVYDNENRFYFARRTTEEHQVRTSFRQFQFYDSGAVMMASKQFDSSFGCYMNLQLCLPCEMDVVGLFGSPNGNNDFADRSGKKLNKPPKLGDETSKFSIPSCLNVPHSWL